MLPCSYVHFTGTGATGILTLPGTAKKADTLDEHCRAVVSSTRRRMSACFMNNSPPCPLCPQCNPHLHCQDSGHPTGSLLEMLLKGKCMS